MAEADSTEQGTLWNDDSIGRRRCSMCDQAKSLSEFRIHRPRNGPPRRERFCKSCHDARAHARRHTPKVKQQGRKSYLRRKYGLGEVSYERMCKACGGLCEICRQPETRITRGTGIAHLCVDHNHVTGEVRGLLCHLCNVLIGNAREDPAILHAAADYLRKRQCQPSSGETVAPLFSDQQSHPHQATYS